jgi:hypothetical protein
MERIVRVDGVEVEVDKIERAEQQQYESARHVVTTLAAQQSLSAARAALTIAARLLEDAQRCDRAQHERARECITGAHALAIGAAAGIEGVLFPRALPKGVTHG